MFGSHIAAAARVDGMKRTPVLLILALLAAAGCAGTDADDGVLATVAPTGTVATTSTVAMTLAKATGPAERPPTQAEGCEPVTDDDIAAVTEVLVPERGTNVVRTGLYVANATAATDSDGVRYIVASIYDDTNFRVSSSDTWVILDGETLALSSSAVEHSTVGDASDVLGLGQGWSSDLRDDLEACAMAALSAASDR